MKSLKNHILISIPFFIIALVLVTRGWNKGTLEYLSFVIFFGFMWILGTAFPDFDVAFKRHRSLFTHTAILVFPCTIIVSIGGYGHLFCGFPMAMAIHILTDVKFKRRHGFYLVRIHKGNSLTYKQSTILYIISSILLFGVSLVVIV